MTRLAIIAGQGHLPLYVARAAAELGYEVFIFPIQGQSDSVFEGFNAKPVKLGAISKIKHYLKEAGCNEMLMVGKVVWPSISALRPDESAVKLLGKLVKRGDDSVLRAIAHYFSEDGIVTISVKKFLAHRAMPSGHVAGPTLSVTDQSLIDIGIDVLDRLGDSDVGQAVVLQNGRVLAIEAAEGTTAMVTRSTGLIDKHAGPAVLLKMQKSGQDNRLDTPFIGIETLQAAIDSGIHVLAIEAGNVLLAEDVHVMSDFCSKYSLTFVGISSKARL